MVSEGERPSAYTLKVGFNGFVKSINMNTNKINENKKHIHPGNEYAPNIENSSPSKGFL
jgi:hypothetical protein